jgi:hypothetical protein
LLDSHKHIAWEKYSVLNVRAGGPYSYRCSRSEIGRFLFLNRHASSPRAVVRREVLTAALKTIHIVRVDNGRNVGDYSLIGKASLPRNLGYSANKAVHRFCDSPHHISQNVPLLLILTCHTHVTKISPVVTICTAKLKIQQFYVLPTHCIYVFCVDLRQNSNYFPIQH